MKRGVCLVSVLWLPPSPSPKSVGVNYLASDQFVSSNGIENKYSGYSGCSNWCSLNEEEEEKVNDHGDVDHGEV